MALGVPTCVSCHGQNGAGVGATFPRLAGQLPDYMASTIELWSTGEDPPDTPEEAIMARIAAVTPPEAMAAAIAYLAGLDLAAEPSKGYPPLDTDWPVETYATNPLPDEIDWSDAASAYGAQQKRLADHGPRALPEDARADRPL